MGVPIHFGRALLNDSRYEICILCSSIDEASEMDPTEPVTLTVDLGGQHKLESLDLSWEFPAKSFAVSVSSDGVKWAEVYATDSNILASTHVSLGSVSASKVRVVMHEVRFFAKHDMK